MTNRRPIDYSDADWYKGGINMIDCDPGFPNGIMVKDMSIWTICVTVLRLPI